MRRLFTHAANLFFFFLHRTCACVCISACARVLRHFIQYLYVYSMYATVHTRYVFICVTVCAPAYIITPPPSLPSASAKVSHLPAPARGRPDSPNLQSSLPPSLPHLSIHLTEGFTLLTVKFTHIHNYVFNQSHLKAGRMQPFSGNGRRSASTLRGPSGLIPAFALPAND